MNSNAPQSRNSAKLTLRRIIAYAVLVLLTIACLFSFYILIINTTRSHPDIQKGFSFAPGGSFFFNWRNIMENDQLPVVSGILNSLFIAICSAALSVYFSAMAAFGIHSYQFRFRKTAFTLIMMIMMIPTQVFALGFVRQMVAMGLRNSFVPLIVPSVAAPVVVFFMKQYMESVLPLEIVEAARIDGSNEFRTFNLVVLPIIKPALAVQGIFALVTSWNNYFMPALLLSNKSQFTLPILIAQLRSADFMKFDMGQVYMLIFISIVPIMVLYLCLSKFIVRGVTLGAIKG